MPPDRLERSGLSRLDPGREPAGRRRTESNGDPSRRSTPGQRSGAGVRRWLSSGVRERVAGGRRAGRSPYSDQDLTRLDNR